MAELLIDLCRIQCGLLCHRALFLFRKKQNVLHVFCTVVFQDMNTISKMNMKNVRMEILRGNQSLNDETIGCKDHRILERKGNPGKVKEGDRYG